MTNSEIIEGLKALRTIHNGNYAPYVDEAIKRISAEPCEDCINRQEAINKMQELEDEDIKAYGCSIPEGFDGRRAIIALKTLQPVRSKPKIEKLIKMRDAIPKEKVGHWIHGICSECGKDGLLESTGEYVCNTFVYRVARSKYCPNCGIEMKKEDEDNE